MEQLIYTKFSNERAARYSLQTEIWQEEDGQRRVVKRACTPEAQAHVENMERVYVETQDAFSRTCFRLNRCRKIGAGSVCFEYITGASLEERLDQILLSDEGAWEREGIPLVESYQKELKKLYPAEDFQETAAFRDIFGDLDLPEKLPAARNVDIDLIFQNILEQDGIWHVIDYEWTFPFPIPIKYVLYRALFFYSHQNDFRKSRLFNEDTFARFGISPRERECFDQMEAHFQAAIGKGYVPLRGVMRVSGREEVWLPEGAKDLESGLVWWKKAGVKEEGRSAGMAEEVNEESKQEGLASGGESGKKPSLFSKIRDKILAYQNRRAMEKKTLFSHIEKVTGEPEQLRVRGWAFTRREAEISFRVVDSCGTEIPFEKREYNRPDVALAITGKEEKVYAGFQLLFLRDDGAEPFSLVISDGKEQETFLLEEENVGSAGEDARSEDWSIGPGYEAWWAKQKATAEELEEQRAFAEADILSGEGECPCFSILVPIYKTPIPYLREMVDSVLAQTWPKWELCLADGSGEDLTAYQVLEEYAQNDARIRVKRLEKNGGISENTNEALAMATGDWIALLDHDDFLAPDALYEMAKKVRENPETDAVYTDEDKVSMDGKQHYDPYFKPDFAPELLLSSNYICHFFAVRKSVVEQAGPFRKEFDGSQDYDFILRCTEKAREVAHIGQILYHWRMHPGSTAADPASKKYCYEAGLGAIREALQRRGIQAEAEELGIRPGYYRVRPAIREDVSIHRMKGTLLSEAEEATEEFLLFEDPLVTPADEATIRLLVADASLPGIAAAGGRILSKDGVILETGRILGLRDFSGSPYRGYQADQFGYFGRAVLRQNVSVLSLRCLVVRRDAFLAVGGFEERLSGDNMAADLCLKLREQGYRLLLDPDAVFYASKDAFLSEDLSLNAEKKAQESQYLGLIWGEQLAKGDPYYSQNLSLAGVGYRLRRL